MLARAHGRPRASSVRILGLVQLLAATSAWQPSFRTPCAWARLRVRGLPLATDDQSLSEADQERCSLHLHLCAISLHCLTAPAPSACPLAHPLAHVSASCVLSCQERLLLSEPALTAFIEAEMRSFCEEAMIALDEDEDATLADKMRREQACPGDDALDAICGATRAAFSALHESGGGQHDVLLSNLGSAIAFFRNEFDQSEELAEPLERVGLSTYQARCTEIW